MPPLGGGHPSKALQEGALLRERYRVHTIPGRPILGSDGDVVLNTLEPAALWLLQQQEVDTLLKGGLKAVRHAVWNPPLQGPKTRQSALILLDSERRPVPGNGSTVLSVDSVLLHVYDLSADFRNVNNVMGAMGGGGAFHVGVEVHGSEWAYGCLGLRQSLPRAFNGHVYNCSVLLGTTQLTQDDFADVLHGLCQLWRGKDYAMLGHNCCSFAAALSRELGVGPLPPWITKLADSILALCKVTSDPLAAGSETAVATVRAIHREASRVASHALQEIFAVLQEFRDTVLQYAGLQGGVKALANAPAKELYLADRPQYRPTDAEERKERLNDLYLSDRLGVPGIWPPKVAVAAMNNYDEGRRRPPIAPPLWPAAEFDGSPVSAYKAGQGPLNFAPSQRGPSLPPGRRVPRAG